MISVYGKSKEGDVVLLPPLFDIAEKSLISEGSKKIGFDHLQ